jgi:hypothetical protein
MTEENEAVEGEQHIDVKEDENKECLICLDA